MSVLSNKIGKSYVMTSALISAAVVLLISITLLINSWDAITNVGWKLLSFNWNPSNQEFGILPMIYGTVAVTLIALIVTLPLGIFTAIFTSEILPNKYRLSIKSILELLAGIPSIIYGLIGIAFFSIWVQDIFDLQSGRTILTAGVLLGIMILPTVITLTDDALQNVPPSYREASKGLGLYKYEVIKNSILPIAKSDIIGAVLLAFGRALGETMAVMLVIGSIDKIPDSIFNWLNPGQTITSKLGREIAESSYGSTHFSTMIFMGLILFVFVLLLTFFAQKKFSHSNRLYE